MKSLMKAVAACAAMCGFAAVAQAGSLWKYAGGYLTELDAEPGTTAWVLPVSTSGTELTIKSGGTTGTSPDLDFTAPFVDASGNEVAHRVVAIAGDGFYNRKTPKNIVFDENMTTLGSCAFQSCSIVSLTAPNITNMAERAFESASSFTTLNGSTDLVFDKLTKCGGGQFVGASSIKGKVVVGGDAPLAPGDHGNGMFERSGAITEAVIGDGVTRLAQFFFLSRTTLTNVTLGTSMATFAQRCFDGCSGVKRLTFRGGVPSFGNGFNGSWKAYQSCWFVPNNNDSWLAFVADPSKVKFYSQCTTAESNNWIAAWGDYGEPVGLTKVGASNQWIFMPPHTAEAKLLNIAGSPKDMGVSTPAYGTQGDVSDLLPLPCSVSEYGVDGMTLYRSVGHRIETSTDAGWVTEEETAETSFSYDVATAGLQRVVWLFDPVGYQVKVGAFPAECGAVLTNTVPILEGHYPKDSVSEWTVVPAAGAEFVRWYGNVPEDQATNLTIRLTMDGEKTVFPYFKTGWTYFGGSNPYITDGYWRVPVSVSGKNLTTAPSITRLSAVGTMPLDFTKPISDGYQLVALGKNTGFNSPQIIYVSELRLPDTVTTVGEDGFSGAKNMKYVYANGLRTISGHSAFNGCSSLLGFNGRDEADLSRLTTISMALFGSCTSLKRVVLGGKDPVSLAGTTNVGIFEGSGVRDVELGDGVSSTGAFLFYNCSSLTNAVLGAGLASLSDRTFTSCSKLKTLVFRGFPTNNAGSAFPSWSDYQTLFIVPKENAGWQNFAATHVTKWKDLDPTVQAKFSAPGWTKPYGLITSASSSEGLNYPKNQWIVFQSGSGMKLIFQ